MNKQQVEAAKVRPQYVVPQGQEFTGYELQILRGKKSFLEKRISDLQTACDFYQDKASILEKLCIENGLMIKGSL